MSGRPKYLTRPALAALAALAVVGSATACTESASAGGYVKDGALVTCTHLSYKPFQFTDDTGKVVGFDVDIVDLVAKELGRKQEVVDTPFEGVQNGEDFNTGKCDLGAAGMTITDERKKAIDFSDPYFDASQALLVKKGAGISDLSQLSGKEIGVQQDTTGEVYANDNKDKYGYTVRQFEDLPLLETAVRTGQISAAINDNGVLYDYVKAFPETEVTTEFDTGEQYGIGVKKGNKELLEVINKVLKETKESKKYDELYQKWFGKAPGEAGGADSN